MADKKNQAYYDAIKAQEDLNVLQSKNQSMLDAMQSTRETILELTNKNTSSIAKEATSLTKSASLYQGIQDRLERISMLNDKDLQNRIQAGSINERIVSAKESQLAIVQKMKADTDVQVQAEESIVKAMQKRADQQKKNEEFFGAFKDKWDDFTAIAQDPKIATGAFMVAAASAGKEFASTMKDAGAELGMSRDQSMQMGGELIGMSLTMGVFGIGAKKLAASYSGLAKEMGGTAGITKDMIKDTAKMAKSYNLSGAEAAKLFRVTSQMSDESAATAKSSLETVSNLARGAGVPIGAVMQDVANSADLIAEFGYDNVEALGKAAVEAAKMGTSLNQMAQTADKLMDIDNARNNAMQLSVMLGRNINIDRAQQLIYAGDLQGGYKEMLNQLGGIQGFNNMDYYQKKAAADMLGVSTGELQKQLNLQAGLTETGEKQPEGWAAAAAKAQDLGAFAKENMTTIAATLNVLGSMKNMKMIMWAKEKAHALLMKVLGKGSKVAEVAAGPLKADGSPDMRFKANKAPAMPETPDTGKLSGKGNKSVGSSLSDLAKGLRDMGQNTFRGIAALAMTGPAMVLALPAIPFLLFMGKVGLDSIADNFSGLSEGLVALGEGTFTGIAAMTLMGPAMLMSVPAIPFLLFFGLTPLGTLAINFKALAKGLASMSKKAMFGTTVLAALGLAGAAMLLAIPGLTFISIMGIPVQVGLGALGKGLGSLGKAAADPFLWLGIAAIGALGIQMIPFGIALAFAGAAMWMFGLGVKLALEPMPPIIEAVAAAVIGIIGAFTSFVMTVSELPLQKLFAMGPAMALMGLGFAALGIGLLIAMPGLALLSLFGPTVFGLLGTLFEQLAPAIEAVGNAFAKIFESAGGFFSILMETNPLHIMGVAAGLFALGLSGGSLLFGSFGLAAAGLAMNVLAPALALIPKDLDLINLAKGLGIMGIVGMALPFASIGIGLFSLSLITLAGALLLLTPVIGTLERLAAIGASLGIGAALGGEAEEDDATIKANNIMLNGTPIDGAAAVFGAVANRVPGGGDQQPAATAAAPQNNQELANMIVAAIGRANFEIMLDGKKVSKQLGNKSGETGV